MPSAVRSLGIASRFAAALGFMALGLTGELSLAWTGASAASWFLSFLLDRDPHKQAQWRRFETPAVVGMIAMMMVDFFIFHNYIINLAFKVFFTLVRRI